MCNCPHCQNKPVYRSESVLREAWRRGQELTVEELGILVRANRQREATEKTARKRLEEYNRTGYWKPEWD